MRLGTVIARDRRALQRWRSHQARLQARAVARRADGSGLTGAALEAAVMSLAMTNPDLVAIRQAPPSAA